MGWLKAAWGSHPKMEQFRQRNLQAFGQTGQHVQGGRRLRCLDAVNRFLGDVSHIRERLLTPATALAQMPQMKPKSLPTGWFFHVCKLW